MKISEILAKYDTDKISFHRYGDAYDEMFSKFDRNAPLNILEIGTQKGGSLQAWKEFFPNANVYGIDIVDVVSDEYRKDNVTRIISDVKEWKNDIEWDIVIDDGSHYLLDIAYVISFYAVKLKVGGCIIIEDVRDPGLLYKVLINLLQDITLIFPNYKHTHVFDGRHYDTSTDAPGSFIIAIFRGEQ